MTIVDMRDNRSRVQSAIDQGATYVQDQLTEQNLDQFLNSHKEEPLVFLFTGGFHTPGILHLKSGVVAIDERRLVAIGALASHAAFHDYEVLRVPDGEEYAANCVRVNDVVFVAAGYPQTHAMLRALGYALEVLDMSEYAKMDGGLSCLSLRY